MDIPSLQDRVRMLRRSDPRPFIQGTAGGIDGFLLAHPSGPLMQALADLADAIAAEQPADHA